MQEEQRHQAKAQCATSLPGQVNLRAAHGGQSVPDREVSHSMLQLGQ